MTTPTGSLVGPRRIKDVAAVPDWLVLLALAMMVASDYKFRRRGLSDALGGTIDGAIIFELSIFALVALSLVASHIVYGERAKPSGAMTALWAYGFVLAASSLYAPYPVMAMVRAVQLVLIIAFAHVLADRAEPEQFRVLSRSYLGLMIGSIAVGLAYVAPTSRYQEGRFTWLHTHTVTAASMLALGLVMGVGLMAIPPRGKRSPFATLVLATTIGLIAVALLMTQTRGSVAGALLGVATFVVLFVSKERRKGVIVLMLLSVVSALYFLLQTVETYVERGEPEEGITTLSNRTALWSVAYERFMEKPLFGWGITASRGLFFDAVQLGGAHNAVVNVAVDGGLIGLAVWLLAVGTLVYTVRRAWVHHKQTRPQLALISGLLVTMMVNGVTMEGVGSGAGSSFIWLCLLIAWARVLSRAPVVAEPRPFGRESRGGLAPVPVRLHQPVEI